MDLPALDLPLGVVPSPDASAEPEAFVVVLGAERIHFLDWGGPAAACAVEPARAVEPERAAEPTRDRGLDPVAGLAAPRSTPGALLIHGLAGTAWDWLPVARRLRWRTRVVAMDLRGHGLSDAPTSSYEPEQLAEDVIAVAEGSALLADDSEAVPPSDVSPSAVLPSAVPPSAVPPDVRSGQLVLAGHGYGGIVAAWAAALLGARCAGLVLVDGGWEDLRETTGMEPDDWLRELAEPPEVMRSMAAFLADRAAFDPATWDADQERAARATVVEVPAGHLLPAIRPHALARSVEAMFAYRPSLVLPAIEAPIVALVAGTDDDGSRLAALEAAAAALREAGRPPIRVATFTGVGHNLIRHRPVEVSAAILALLAR